VGHLNGRTRPAARLRRLRVRDFLLIEEADLALAPGLNVLSGETGTGKSILLHALGLLLGRRGSTEWIRRGASKLWVEGTFEAPSAALRWARRAGIPISGSTLLATRELSRRGGSRCFVNGRRVLVRTLARLGALLVETHGQREEERFRRAEAQRDLLDRYAGLAAERRAVRDAWQAARAAGQACLRAREEIERLARDEDWMRFQLEEIERLRPEPGEEEALRARLAELRRAAARGEFLLSAEEALNAGDGALLSALETLDHRAGGLEADDEALAAWRAQLRELLERARDLYRGLRRLGAGALADAAELAGAEARSSELERLARKHRRPLAEVCALAGELRAGLDLLAAGEERAAALDRELAERREALRREAQRLTRRRAKAAGALARDLAGELGAIEMSRCRLRVALLPLAGGAAESASETAGIGPAGAERVAFEVETNPGEGFRPLGEIASGGEMARIALALRVVLGARGAAQLAVFDEIDAGLGGGAARVVAQRLGQVAADRQVLLVTHLPVIAAAAQRQLRVTKEERGGRARVEVAAVRGEERIAEIARMLGGRGEDAQARRHARALLEAEIELPRRGGSANA